MFPVYGGKCLSRKAVNKWFEIFSQGRSKVADDEMKARKWLRQQSKYFYSAGFDTLVKRQGKCVNIFSRLEYHHFWRFIPFVTYLLTHLHIRERFCEVRSWTQELSNFTFGISTYFPTYFGVSTSDNAFKAFKIRILIFKWKRFFFFES
jgi:hypothetical protein